MSKRIIILVLILLLTLTSCGVNTSGGENSKTNLKKVTDIPMTSEAEEDDTEGTGSVETDVKTTEITDPQTTPNRLTEIEPNQSHVGTWLSENSTYWANVISVGNDQVTVNFGSARSFGLEAVAVERDGKYYFSKELSPHFDWSPYSSFFRSYEDLINGYIEFSEDSFTVTAEKLFLGTEGDVVTIKFLKQAEGTGGSNSVTTYTEGTPPVTVPFEEIFTTIIPDESYVGEWRHYISFVK